MTESMKTELLERIKDTVMNMGEPERTIHLEKLLELHGEKSVSAERERIKKLIEYAFIAGRSKTTWEQFKKDNELGNQ